jgi:hypothetical protein
VRDGRDQEHRGRPDAVGDPPDDRAERGAGDRVDGAGDGGERVAVGRALDDEEQGQRRHADAEPPDDAERHHHRRTGDLPHSLVLAQRDHDDLPRRFDVMTE